MFKNYVKMAWRNVRRHKLHALINIAGLSVGMGVAMLIAFWIWDELSFDRYHTNYNRIAQVMENDVHSGAIHTGKAVPLPLDVTLRKNYSGDFKHIAMASWTESHVLSAGEKNISYAGNFIGEEAPDMFSLHMLEGSIHALQDASSIIISNTVAKALFGDAEPMNQMIKLDNKAIFKVAGVYEELPSGSSLHGVRFMASWNFFVNAPDWLGRDANDWSDNSLFMYVQIADNADMANVSERIKHIKRDNYPAAAQFKPELFLQPMSKWHLYGEFTNGVNTGGAIEYVWLFGIIGAFVLLLACINFMNLSTARSEKRAEEVGIRKAVGSLRIQLIGQFFCESLLMAFFAFVLALIMVWLALPAFNDIARKAIAMPWRNGWFWIGGVSFTLLTGLIAGSYPAFYLSSFQPVKVLKGAFRAGKLSAIPRKALVVIQFTVSIILIISTIVVFRQIQFAKDRPVGYSQEGLIDITTSTSDLQDHFEGFKNDLLQSGAVSSVAMSSSPTYGINNNRNDVQWKEKDPGQTYSFGSVSVSTEYGKTIGWQIKAGRDFMDMLRTDSFAIVLNEAAVKYMGITDPVGKVIQFRKRLNTVIGVAKDMVMNSPYQPAKPTIFFMGSKGGEDIILRINPRMSANEALDKIEKVCKVYSPSVPFAYKFVDEAYAKKFREEVRVGNLATVFAVLAIFISCLGLFGMASFMAAQRMKEIGIRKVLGASVFTLWRLLSSDFIVLVFIAFLIATPVAYYYMYSWLQGYNYRTQLSWWLFAAPGVGALVITVITVSFETIKTAMANPVKSLGTE